MEIHDRQRELEAAGLARGDLHDDPFEQFSRWFDDAHRWGVHQPEAMVLATSDPQGVPAARHVLLKEVDTAFVFYTNYGSRKGHELDANPHAALCFPWIVLSRQVRIVGTVTRTSGAESDEYFATRPRASQIGAWGSRQSEVIEDRGVLERWVDEAEQRFSGVDVERPAGWGGYRLVPTEFEFWQGRPSRLHDRFRYLRSGGDFWHIDRLSP